MSSPRAQLHQQAWQPGYRKIDSIDSAAAVNYDPMRVGVEVGVEAGENDEDVNQEMAGHWGWYTAWPKYAELRWRGGVLKQGHVCLPCCNQ